MNTFAFFQNEIYLSKPYNNESRRSKTHRHRRQLLDVRRDVSFTFRTCFVDICFLKQKRSCEFSVGDNFKADKIAENVDQQAVKFILVAKVKEFDVMEAFVILGLSDELTKDSNITARWESVPNGDKWRCKFVTRDFRHDDLKMEGFFISSYTVDMHAVCFGYSILCWMQRTRIFMLRKTKNSIAGFQKSGSRSITLELDEFKFVGGS